MESQGVNFHQQVVIGITSGLILLTTFVVYLRLYIRCILKAEWAGWDDLTVFIAWIMAAGTSIATYLEISFGLGRHVEELSPHQMRGFNVSRFVAIQLYTVGLNFVKLSFLAQFYRSFAHRTIRRICICFAFYCCMWMVVQCILYSFSCVPIQDLLPIMSSVCIPSLGIWTAITTINVLTNVIIFCIPLRPLWLMPLLLRQGYLLVGILCFGLFICLISIARIPTLRYTAASADPSFTYRTTALLKLAELEMAIICTSLPVLRPIFARLVSGASPPPSIFIDQLVERPGPGRPDENKRRARYHDESPLNTKSSGSTLTSRSFFKSLTTRDEDKENEQRVLPPVADFKPVEINGGPRDEKKMSAPKIVEVNQRKEEEGKALDTLTEFFHRPGLEKVTQKPPPIVPRDLRKDASPESSWKVTPTLTIHSSPQSSTRRLLITPMSPVSTQSPGNDTNRASSAPTTNSCFKSRQRTNDNVCDQDGCTHACNVTPEALTRVCSMCSSELLPEHLRQSAPPPIPPHDQAHDAGTQTFSSRERRASIAHQSAGDAMVTQSTQTAIPWELSSSESSRPASPPTSEEGRVEIDVARQGTITRARERAMQAIADRTVSQVGAVHQGRARVVQVDTSQRRQAAIGVEEVLGLDADCSPRRPVRSFQGRKGSLLVPGASLNRPTKPSASLSERVQIMEELERTPTQQKVDGTGNESEVEGTVATSKISRSQDHDARDQLDRAPSPTGTLRRAAGTSWLRLSTDLGL